MDPGLFRRLYPVLVVGLSDGRFQSWKLSHLSPSASQTPNLSPVFPYARVRPPKRQRDAGARRKEIAQAEISIQFVLTKLNHHVTKLRPGVAPPRALASSRGKTTAAHATLEDALEAAQACRKCRATKPGVKGCQECMGDWFDQIRTRGK